MNQVDLYVTANLARAYDELADYDKSTAIYRTAAAMAARMIVNPFANADIASEALASHAAYCVRHQLPADADQVLNSLTSAREQFEPESPRRLAIDLAIARYVMAQGGDDALNEVLLRLIQEAEARSGTRSEAVQVLYASFARMLADAGRQEWAIRLMRARLPELDYFYLERLLTTPPESERKRARIIRWKCRLDDYKARLNREKIAAATAQAAKAYQTGDMTLSFTSYADAARLGCRNSMFMIGTYHQVGIGTPVDMEAARECYLWASRRDHADAQNYYGALLQMGLGGAADRQGAFYWYCRAGEQNHAASLKNAVGVCDSLVTAIELRLRAAEAGAPDGMELALDYFGYPVSALVKV